MAVSKTILEKMITHRSSDHKVDYHLTVDGELVLVNDWLGKSLSMKATGTLFCTHCTKKTAKLFSGFCAKCSNKLAQADMCSVRPELCHFFKGTCREPQWAVGNCFIPHTIYLSVTSDLKVGITRSHHQLQRWMDQGAVQAIELGQTNSRFEAGAIEIAIAKSLSDKTSWQKMLKGLPEEIDLEGKRDEVLPLVPGNTYFRASTTPVERFIYPVQKYPEKVHTLSLEDGFESSLMGIKGQYLIFEDGVINMRKYQGYQVSLCQPI